MERRGLGRGWRPALVTAVAAALSWQELVVLLDVPSGVHDPKEQAAILREWRAQNLEQLAAIDRKCVTAGLIASYVRLRAACWNEIELCNEFLAAIGASTEAYE